MEPSSLTQKGQTMRHFIPPVRPKDQTVARSTQWKRKEETLAKMFGSTRRPLSGGNSKTGRDDSLHPTLFLDSKYGDHAPIYRTHDEIRHKAASEKQGRVPVLALFKKGHNDCLLVIHVNDFYKVCEEFLAARGLCIADTSPTEAPDNPSLSGEDDLSMQATLPPTGEQKNVPSQKPRTSPLPHSRSSKPVPRPRS
jgi:hypothetical protein